ncbi:MAG: hypothetical protein NUV84_02595 [Candidatus Uhrbacteria bacterium]|nr:hypothetical protein [Candidatus Uhrbacteria bacterium]
MSHNKHLLLMLLGCGLMILVLVVFKDRLTEGWLFALVIGACVIPHLFMMRGDKHGEHPHEDPQASVAPSSDDKPTTNKGGSCCH